MKPRTKSQELHARASRVIPGGVDSPVRAFKSVGGEPPFIVRGKGSRIWDADGNEYIDYVGSWGPLILGHAFPSVVEAVEKASHGASFGACTPAEAELAEAVIEAFPSMEKCASSAPAPKPPCPPSAWRAPLPAQIHHQV